VEYSGQPKNQQESHRSNTVLLGGP